MKKWFEWQQSGQCFLMNEQYISWKKRDVIHWLNIYLSHEVSNSDYYDRYSFRINDKIQL
jgi:hypothetical protein